uniref:uncharacterized mitochondrial protein AtMg00810-like n=1 Tax=Erigeron canadensis TaxID=72917 RepID=UPI001CB94C90|nr:uncharacterized mitochondrial protein AtMg00810-like [Erigeron canadensis]
MVTVRCMLTIVVNNNWPLFQLDVNNAFLYGDLCEDVYMDIPQGYSSENNFLVCKLNKSLYGLKQAPRQWNSKLSSALLECGFSQSKSDYSLFTRNINGNFVALLVYVDDIVITGNCVKEIEQVKSFLSTKFKIKDLGKLKFFLGIEVLENDNGLCFSQRKYCLELLNDFGMLGCKPMHTPLEMNITVKPFTKNGKMLDNITVYQKLIGKLIYLTLTRPDISYSVQCLSQFMHAPSQEHFDLGLRILRYVKKAPGKGLFVQKGNNSLLTGYVDYDWARCVTTRKSVTSFTVYLGNTLVSWKSKKQPTVAKSSAEAEYRALAAVTCEIIWLKNLLLDFGITCSIPVNVHCDSKAAIQIAANPVFHEKTKHLEIDLYFVREKISAGLLNTVKIQSELNAADVFTKRRDKLTKLEVQFWIASNIKLRVDSVISIKSRVLSVYC